MNNLSRLDVYIDCVKVGSLAMMRNGMAAFQYNDAWIRNGFEISPFDLPLTSDVYIPKNTNCRGLFGVFEDSLPDSWGTLLVDRKLGELGIDPGTLNILDRLSMVNENGASDMEYRPAAEIPSQSFTDMSFDDIKEACDLLMSGSSSRLDEIYERGGSSGGSRPKVYIRYKNSDWLVKFPLRSDDRNIGKMEYQYAQVAGKCGIRMSETHLFPSEKCDGYFGIRRFDRTDDGNREHVVTAKGLLDLPFDTPSLDYISLLQLTDVLTAHNKNAIRQMYLLAIFNVAMHNQDDHSKNFSYIYDKKKLRWNLAPAYDLTYSTTAFNQHTTSVNWKGNPSREDLLAIAEPFGISVREANQMIGKVFEEAENCRESVQ